MTLLEALRLKMGISQSAFAKKFRMSLPELKKAEARPVQKYEYFAGEIIAARAKVETSGGRQALYLEWDFCRDSMPFNAWVMEEELTRQEVMKHCGCLYSTTMAWEQRPPRAMNALARELLNLRGAAAFLELK